MRSVGERVSRSSGEGRIRGSDSVVGGDRSIGELDRCVLGEGILRAPNSFLDVVSPAVEILLPATLVDLQLCAVGEPLFAFTPALATGRERLQVRARREDAELDLDLDEVHLAGVEVGLE